MTEYAPGAAAQVSELRAYYEARDRAEALRNLDAALHAAEARIEQHPEEGLPAPRPYPFLARPGRAWLKSGRYWVAYTLARPSVIIGVFYESADIPGRAEPDGG